MGKFSCFKFLCVLFSPPSKETKMFCSDRLPREDREMFMGNVRAGNGLDWYVTTSANIDWGNFRVGKFLCFKFSCVLFSPPSKATKMFCSDRLPGEVVQLIF